MSNLSGVIQNGQTLGFNSGVGAIAANALVQTGGPGNEAWPVVTTDHAAVSAQQVFTPVSANGGGAVNNYAHWEPVTDALGNFYVLTPNTAGQGANVTKFSPSGAVSIASTALDSTAHAMISMRLVLLSNSTFAAIYVDSTTGAVRFVVFDAGLTLIAGPTAVATGYVTGAVAYLDACALSAGGFALVYVNSGHSAVTLQTYSSTGGAVLAATSVQATAGTSSLTYLKIGQLSSGNLVVAMRQTATPAGTSFVIVSTAGASVTTNTVVDATSTLGFTHLSVLPVGGFAIAAMNGTNVIAAAYSATGVLQGSAYSAADTLNNTTYSQIQLTNDGTNFYLFYVQSAGGLTVVQLTAAGTSAIAVTGLLSATFTSTSSIAASVSNNMAIVLQASVTTGGQKYVTLGLPDSSLGIIDPYVITGATAVGSAAGTTGSYWPTVRALGDFTALAIYDQQSTGNVYAGVIKFAASAIQGIGQNTIAAGAPGSALTVNPGAGSYPAVAMAGTNALTFDHSNTGGNRGVLYTAGVSLANPAISVASASGSPTGLVTTVAVSSTYVYTANATVLLTITVGSTDGGTGATVTVNGALFIVTNAGADTQPTYGPIQIAMASGQSVTVVTSATALAILSVQRIS